MDLELTQLEAAVMEPALHRALLIRTVEEQLLKLFSEGRLSGTTHTCIGQELSAVMIAAALDSTRDVIFSNHRCHGHYIAWTDDVEGLIAEVMGRRTGPCAGIGGSQHLCGPGFFSNGVQGGIVPVAAGMALAQKFEGDGAITAVCIGDGTLGEGVLYETLNIAMRWRLPLLILLENNHYAQSTAQKETLAGDICARAAAFGMPTAHSNTWEYRSLAQTLRHAASQVRSACAPMFVRIDTYRLAAHSKGDDNRDPLEIAHYTQRDPLNQWLTQADSKSRADRSRADASQRVARAIESAAQELAVESLGDVSAMLHGDERRTETPDYRPVIYEPRTQRAALNDALAKWLATDQHAVVLGEDVRAPYGGAFKVTQGLSDLHGDRVINCPISEAALVGIGNGLALKGWRPIVEIMFGDFLTLCFDQIVNHTAKFEGMYNGRVAMPILIRAPMGGGRGYGPTHSQNLEKHIAGIPGISVLVLHGRTRIAQLFDAIRAAARPCVMIENKLLYNERPDNPMPQGYSARETSGGFPTTVLSTDAAHDLTIVAFGRMSMLVEEASHELAINEEIFPEIVLPLRVWPMDIEPILASVNRTGRLIVVEEGAAGFDLGAEVIAAVATVWAGPKPLVARRLGAKPAQIPSSPELERRVLPQTADIRAACLDLFLA